MTAQQRIYLRHHKSASQISVFFQMNLTRSQIICLMQNFLLGFPTIKSNHLENVELDSQLTNFVSFRLCRLNSLSSFRVNYETVTQIDSHNFLGNDSAILLRKIDLLSVFNEFYRSWVEIAVFNELVLKSLDKNCEFHLKLS